MSIPRLKSMDFIKEQVEEAELVGNIGKVRHLTFLAFDSYIKENFDPIVDFEDMKWAFAYGIKWGLKHFEFNTIIKAYKSFVYQENKIPVKERLLCFAGKDCKKTPQYFDTASDNPYKLIISFLISSLLFDNRKAVEFAKKVFLFEFNDVTDNEDKLLLSLFFEFLWYSKWDDKELRNASIDTINNLKSGFKNDLQLLYYKFSSFREFFFPEVEKPKGSSLREDERNAINKYSELINSFLNIEQESYSKKLLQLKSGTSYGSEYYLLIQSFINMTRAEILSYYQFLDMRTQEIYFAIMRRTENEDYILDSQKKTRLDSSDKKNLNFQDPDKIFLLIYLADFKSLVKELKVICKYLKNPIEELVDVEQAIRKLENTINNSSALDLSDKRDIEKLFTIVKSILHSLIADWQKDQGGLNRYYRFMLENQYRVFQKLREAEFDKNLSESIKGTSRENRLVCLRLIFLLKTSNIRNYDFWGYIESLKRERDVNLHFSFFEPVDFSSDRSNFLFETLLLTLTTFDFKEKKDKMIEAEYLLELTITGKEKIEELIRRSLLHKPRRKNYVLELLRITSDAIPENCLKNVIKWQQEYKRKPFNSPYNKFDQLYINMWSEIIEYLILSDENWKELSLLLTNFFNNPSLLNRLPILFETSLIKAPLKYSEKWLDVIFKLIKRNNNDSINQDKFLASIPFYAVQKNIALKPYVQSIIDELLKKYKDDMELQLNAKLFKSNYDIDVFIKENEEFVAEWNKGQLNHLVRFVEQIKKDQMDNRIMFGYYFDWTLFKINWKKEDEDLIIETITSAFKLNLTEEHAKVLYRAMNDLIFYGSQAIRNFIIDLLVNHWKQPSKYKSISDFTDVGPFATFIVKKEQDPIIYWLMVAGENSYKYASNECRKEIIRFALEYGQIHCSTAGHAAGIFLQEILHLTDIKEKIKAVYILISLINSTIDSLDFQKHISSKVKLYLSSDIEVNDIKVNPMKLMEEQNIKDDLFQEITKWLYKIYWKPLPDLRKKVAELTKLLLENGFDQNEQLNIIKEKLSCDCRARVRQVWNN